MANLEGTPSYQAFVRRLETTDPRHPDTWNPNYQALINNDAYLKRASDQLQGDVASQADRLAVVENESAGSVSQALRLDWLYSAKKQIALELFYDSWTLLDGLTNRVTDAVAGDDSLDVDTVDGLKVGEEYVIFDDTHQERITLTSILTATRIRCAANLAHSYQDAKIRKTSWDTPGARAVARDGGIYIASGINLGDESQAKAAVIRRQDNDLQMAVFYQDAGQTAWKEAAWSWKREVSPGVVDVEYLLPVRGIFNVMAIATAEGESQTAEIMHIAIVDTETGLKGTHNPPATPSIVSPEPGATDVDEQPSITTSAYSHPADTSQGGAQFQISKDSESSEIIDESWLAAGISYSPQAGVLDVDTVYYTRARYIDIKGGVSEWSEVASFTTASVFNSVNKPACTSPAAGDELGSPDSLTLVSSDFAHTGDEDTQSASQWQVLSDSACSDILHDSGENTANFTSYVVPDGVVKWGGTYYWRVRHQGSTGGWSDWSVVAVFSVSVVPSVEDVFSTTLYTGTGGAQDIVNGLDLAGDGGMVWLKRRNYNAHHWVFDTERGATKRLVTDQTSAEGLGTSSLTSFNADGFSLGTSDVVNSSSGSNNVAWAFKKAENFFDIVTWEGNGQAGRKISHGLGAAPGMIIAKNLSNNYEWPVYHRSKGPNYYLRLNTTENAITNPAAWNNTLPTETDFTVYDSELINISGDRYVAYLFAHDISEVGMVQCGSYAGNGSYDGPEINLGWTPQFLLVKKASGSSDWTIYDTERGLGTTQEFMLRPNLSIAEAITADYFNLTPTGFEITDDGSLVNSLNQTYIYMAIRQAA